MDNKKILESAREKIQNEQNAEGVAGQDKSLLGDVIGMVASGMAGGANSGGKPNIANLLGQIQSIINLAGGMSGNSAGNSNAAGLLGQIQNIANLAGGNSAGNANAANLLSQISNLVGGNSAGNANPVNLLSQIQNIANLAGGLTSSNTQPARPPVVTASTSQPAQSESTGGKVSGRKPNGRVAKVARNVAEQLRERKKG